LANPPNPFEIPYIKRYLGFPDSQDAPFQSHYGLHHRQLTDVLAVVILNHGFALRRLKHRLALGLKYRAITHPCQLDLRTVAFGRF